MVLCLRPHRKKIITFEGSYHGHADVILGRNNHKGVTTTVAPGVINDLVVLEYGADSAVEYIKNNASEIAGVLIEPVQSRFPENQPQEFLNELRTVTESNKIAFIWDEVITGFRAAVGGAQEYFGIRADIAAYGKVLGGGMPIGAIAGKSEYLDYIDGGSWEFGDSSFPKNDMTFFAGTFCKHPITMAACHAVLTEMKENGKEHIDNLNTKTDKLANELNHFFEDIGVDLKIVHFSSLFRFKFTGNVDWLFYALNEKGHYIWEGRNMFISTAHSQKDIDQFITDIKSTVKKLTKINYIPTKKKSIVNTKQLEVDMIGPHKRFTQIMSSNSLGSLASTIFVTVDMQGSINIPNLKESITEICDKVDSLSAQYNYNENKVIFSETEAKLLINQIDLSGVKNSENELIQLLKNEAQTQLKKNSNIEFLIVKITESRHILQFKTNHLASDGLSLAFLTEEIAKHYNYLTHKIKSKEVKFRKFSNYLQTYSTEQSKMKDKKKFWEAEIKKISPLPFKVNNDLSAFRLHTSLNESEFKKIRLFGYKNKSSLFTTLLSCFSSIICKKLSIETITIAYPSAGHTSIKEPLVGNCVNLFPITISPNEYNSTEDLAKYLKQKKLIQSRQKDFFINKVNIDKPFSVVFNVEPIDEMPNFKDITTDIISHPITASEFPIILNAMKVNGQLIIEIDFQEQHFEAESAKEIIKELRQKLLNT